MEDFNIKSLECMAYLVARGHSAKLVKPEFDTVSEIPRHEGCKKVEKPVNKVIFILTFNSRGQDASQIINCHMHLIKNTPFLNFPNGSILNSKKRQNLKDLLVWVTHII